MPPQGPQGEGTIPTHRREEWRHLSESSQSACGSLLTGIIFLKWGTGLFFPRKTLPTSLDLVGGVSESDQVEAPFVCVCAYPRGSPSQSSEAWGFYLVRLPGTCSICPALFILVCWFLGACKSWFWVRGTPVLGRYEDKESAYI